MRQPRILVVDASGRAGLAYDRFLARLQPMEVRVETSLEKALGTLHRDSWDLGIVTSRDRPTADALYAALKEADPQLPMVVIDSQPSVERATWISRMSSSRLNSSTS